MRIYTHEKVLQNTRYCEHSFRVANVSDSALYASVDCPRRVLPMVRVLGLPVYVLTI